MLKRPVKQGNHYLPLPEESYKKREAGNDRRQTALKSRSLKSQLVAESLSCATPGAGGGGVLPKKLGRGVRPASQNPYPIYDQNLRFSLPYL